jgi:hypothetical protein
MRRTLGSISLIGPLVFAGLLTAGAASSALAAETSGCVTCHLDEAMLLKNLGETKAKKSAMQSGAG